MRSLRNLVVALALIPAIAACSAGGNSALPAAANVAPQDNVNSDVVLSDNYVDASQDSSNDRNTETHLSACPTGLSCVSTTILRPLQVRMTISSYVFTQSPIPTQVKVTRPTVMSIYPQNVATDANCHSTCVVVAVPQTNPSTLTQAGFIEGVTVQNSNRVPVVTTRQLLPAGTYYLYLAQKS